MNHHTKAGVFLYNKNSQVHSIIVRQLQDDTYDLGLLYSVEASK